jgi:hypothetical protein
MPSLNTGNAILSNAIAVDSSYNVGIGGAASGSFKLQVTGTSNLTGALSGTSATFSGLLSGGNSSPSLSYNAGSWFTGDGLVVGNISSVCGIQINSSTTSTLSAIRFGDGDGANNLYDQGFIIYNHSVDRMTLGANRSSIMHLVGGNVLIGTTTFYNGNFSGSASGLNINAAVPISLLRDAAGNTFYMGLSGTAYIGTQNAIPISFLTSDTERMRITSGGYTKISNTGSYNSVGSAFHELRNNSNDNEVVNITHAGSSPYGISLYYVNATPNNASNWFAYFGDSTAQRFSVRSNGGIYNYQANDLNLSDERTKKDIIPLESYWDKFKAIEIVKFKYKDQTHDDFNIGVIAQQVEKVAPEFVDIDSWNSKPKLDEQDNIIISNEEPIKSIYTSDLHHATIKVLQECMAKIEEQQAQIEELKQFVATK